MLSLLLPAASLLLGGLPGPAAAQTVPSDNCTTDGVHLIVARASVEKQGEGIIGAVANEILFQVPGSDSVAVVYPATLTNYIQSETAGITAMNALISEYVASCPDSKFALLGYSQGAQVVGDVLCGTSEPGWAVTNNLNSTYGANFVAAIQMGDPSYVPNQPQDAGTSSINGIFNRTNPAGCLPYESRMQSYCDTGDFFCARGVGPNAFAIHVGYVVKYGASAANYVASQFTAAVSGGSTSSSASTTTTATSSGSSSVGAGTTTPTGSGMSTATVTSTATDATTTPSGSSSTTPATTVTTTPAASTTPAGTSGAGQVAAPKLLACLIVAAAVFFGLS